MSGFRRPLPRSPRLAFFAFDGLLPCLLALLSPANPPGIPCTTSPRLARRRPALCPASIALRPARLARPFLPLMGFCLAFLPTCLAEPCTSTCHSLHHLASPVMASPGLGSGFHRPLPRHARLDRPFCPFRRDHHLVRSNLHSLLSTQGNMQLLSMFCCCTGRASWLAYPPQPPWRPPRPALHLLLCIAWPLPGSFPYPAQGQCAPCPQGCHPAADSFVEPAPPPQGPLRVRPPRGRPCPLHAPHPCPCRNMTNLPSQLSRDHLARDPMIATDQLNPLYRPFHRHLVADRRSCCTRCLRIFPATTARPRGVMASLWILLW